MNENYGPSYFRANIKDHHEIGAIRGTQTECGHGPFVDSTNSNPARSFDTSSYRKNTKTD